MKALILGVRGQDASLLSEHLLNKDYTVVGTIRRASCHEHHNLEKSLTYPNFHLEYGDITDAGCMSGLISKYQPDEIYVLAAQSHVQVSFTNPIATFESNTMGFLNVLEAARIYSPNSSILFAATSEQFGDQVNERGMQDENTLMNPRSPYGVSKLASYKLAHVYRESYDMKISCSICFNHESERRGLNFVTMKVADYVAHRIADPKWRKPLTLYNLHSYRDWISAHDVVKAMSAIIHLNDDFVVASGKTRSITELLNVAFSYPGINPDWSTCVEIAENNRPLEVPMLCGDSTKLHEATGWKPTISFRDMIFGMIKSRVDYHKQTH
jgi:GDPmannose 4,6-dehydratase